MPVRFSLRWLTLGALAFTWSATNALALLKFNDGHDQIFVTGTAGIGYDSNIFASAGGAGDFLTTSSLLLEYARRAGMISVNGSIGWNLGSFQSNPGSDFSNPSVSLEFVKNTGRTTGSFTLSATRQSQADPNINMRTDAWNYNAGLNWKYPVIERYSLAGGLGYGLLDYADNSASLVDLATYYANMDLFYAYTSQRDLLAGYRIRVSDTSNGGQSIDHAFTVGVSGKILAKLNGTVRAGYQIRQEASGQTFDSTTASAAVTWTISKRMNLTGSLNKDFSTTGTDSSMDSLSANLDAQYVLSNHWTAYSGIGWGHSVFLDGVDKDRSDFYYTWNVGLGYNLNDHFKASLSYSYTHNWSNRSQSTYDRNAINFTVTSRW